MVFFIYFFPFFLDALVANITALTAKRLAVLWEWDFLCLPTPVVLLAIKIF